MKTINNLLRVFLIVFGFCGLYFVQHLNIVISFLITIPCLFILTILPTIIEKIFKYKMSDKLICFYLIFIIIALEVGSLYDYYQQVSWLDLFSHFVSGAFMSYVATIILKENKISYKQNKLFYITFIISFSLAIAGLWEIGEFIADRYFGANAQLVSETGVADTMGDIIIASIATIFYTVIHTLKLKVYK